MCLALATAGDSAADDPRREEAATRFRRGVTLFQEGDYPGALVEFEGAYRASPRFEVLFNLGVTERRLYRYQDALRTLQRYLDEGGAKVPRERRADVERELREIRALVAEVTVRVAGPPAEIEVDGRAVGQTPLDGPLLLGGGRHVVIARRAGEEPDERAVKVVSGERLAIALAPRPRERAAARLEVTTSPPGAAIRVDGRPFGAGDAAAALEPGGHLVEAALDGHRPARVEVVLAEGQTRAITIELEPLPRTAPPPPWYATWYVWTGVAVLVAGGAAAGIGGYFATKPDVVDFPF